MRQHEHEYSPDSAARTVSRWWRTTQFEIAIPIAKGILAAGTPLAAFADNAGASAPGITLIDSKGVCIRWNNAATQTAVFYKVNIPQEVDTTQPFVVHALVSKSGATLGDATTLTVAAYLQVPGGLHDFDADFGGASNAVTGNLAAKTISELTRTLAAANFPSNPSSAPVPMALTLSVKPTDGTLGTDDFMLHKLWIEATRLGLKH